MAKTRVQTWLAAIVVIGVGGLLLFIGGLFAYVNFTAVPLHPDAANVPSATQSQPQPSWANAVTQGRQIARTSVSEQNLPGLSVAVGAGGEIIWAEGFGFADLEKKSSVTPETKFRIAEVSKALTSAGAGLLLEKNELNLDDEIQKYVPDYPKKEWPVTVRQLMAHVAGLRDDAGDEAPIHERCERTVDAVKFFDDHAPLFQPGTNYRASSYSWILVSAAVEAAAHERFFPFMRTRVFEPLGMSATVPDLSFSESIPNRATFYFPRFAGDTKYGPESVRDGDYSCFAGAGGFLSTPSDLVRFGIAVNGGKLLQPATVERLQTPQRLTSGEQTDYGLGWRVETVPLAGEPTRMAGHGTKEDFLGGTAYLMTLPARGIVVAVTSNISFADLRSVALKIADAFAGQEKGSPRK